MINTPQKNKVGLVLGGGGARGFFHVGVIKGLQKLKIKIDEIAGTSIGSVIGAMWAANPGKDIENVIKDVDLREIIRFVAWESKSKNPENVKKYIKRFVKADTFEELKIKLKISATDINSGEEVVFEKGSLYPGLIASISIPGIFRPVEYGKRYLVDGGVINNVPATLIDSASTLIVSDITGPLRKIDNKSLRIDVLYSSLILLQKELSRAKMKPTKDKKIIYFNLEDNKVSILDFRKQNFQRLINLGYKEVMSNKSDIMKAAALHSLDV